MEEAFENVQVGIENLPRIEDIQFIQLEPAYLKVRLWSMAILFTVLLVPIGIFVFYQWDELPIILLASVAGLWFLLLVWSILVTYYGFFRKGYALRSKDVLYKSGLIWRSQTVIPFNRVQHCEVSQGPIARWMKVASLEVFTAGGTNSDMTIPGLQPNVAYRLKDFIIQQTAFDEEE